MKPLYHRLLLLLAVATQKQLAAHIRYLKTENEILRSKLPHRVPPTKGEKNRLTRFGARLGRALDELVTIVHPCTLHRWIREAAKSGKKKLAAKGRPRTKEQMQRLILKMAHDSGWGYTRIMGELKKLGIKPPSRNTVKNILKANGLDPGPKRSEGTWDEFLKMHAASLWQCDFFSKKVLTPKGLRDAFVLVFLHVGTRRAVLSPATFHPNQEWMEVQSSAFLKHVQETKIEASSVMHDRDKKFSRSFDESLKSARIKVIKSAYRSPNTVAFVERFVQTVNEAYSWRPRSWAGFGRGRGDR
jgi:putative transposase